jgi:hypothetical protein
MPIVARKIKPTLQKPQIRYAPRKRQPIPVKPPLVVRRTAPHADN